MATSHNAEFTQRAWDIFSDYAYRYAISPDGEKWYMHAWGEEVTPNGVKKYSLEGALHSRGERGYPLSIVMEDFPTHRRTVLWRNDADLPYPHEEVSNALTVIQRNSERLIKTGIINDDRELAALPIISD